MLPIESEQQAVIQTDDTLQVGLVLQVKRDLFWFNGHFTHQPLLPGVAQLDWVMHYATTLLVPGGRFSSIENIKFQHPIVPEKRVRLLLTWHPAKQLLTFSYHLLEGSDVKIASSGKIKLIANVVNNACH